MKLENIDSYELAYRDQALASLRIETLIVKDDSYLGRDQALASLRIETEDNSEESGDSGRSGSREPAD